MTPIILHLRTKQNRTKKGFRVWVVLGGKLCHNYVSNYVEAQVKCKLAKNNTQIPERTLLSMTRELCINGQGSRGCRKRWEDKSYTAPLIALPFIQRCLSSSVPRVSSFWVCLYPVFIAFSLTLSSACSIFALGRSFHHVKNSTGLVPKWGLGTRQLVASFPNAR